ncbi:MAG: hypothetical protein ACP5QU_05085 [Anaerolineae bacterium]
MSEMPSSGGKRSVWQDTAVVVAVITVIGSIITTFITNLPQIMARLEKTPTPTVAPATATFAPMFTPEPSLTPTMTFTPLPPTETPLAFTPTETPLPVYVPPSFSCLDGWTVVSDDASFAPKPLSQGKCSFSSLPELGMVTSGDTLFFGLSKFRPLGIYGIAAPLPPEGGTVTLTVRTVSVLGGEFWLAFSNDPLPMGHALIFAFQPQSGEVRIYKDNPNDVFASFPWSQLRVNTAFGPNSPYTYQISVKIEGNNVRSRINAVSLPAQVVNLPRSLFIGLHKKSTLDILDLNLRLFDLKFTP